MEPHTESKRLRSSLSPASPKRIVETRSVFVMIPYERRTGGDKRRYLILEFRITASSPSAALSFLRRYLREEITPEFLEKILRAFQEHSSKFVRWTFNDDVIFFLQASTRMSGKNGRKQKTLEHLTRKPFRVIDLTPSESARPFVPPITTPDRTISS